MGVYIKDLWKPEYCDVCPIHLVFKTCGRDPEHCMFQDVPEPHGRLIDADALEYEEAYLNGHYELGDVEIVTRKDIESAPTIIPASEEE